MKKIIVLILICFVQNIFAQGLPPLPKAGSYTTEAPVGQIPAKSTNDDVIDENIYDKSFVEVKPEFPGGRDEFINYLEKNFTKPTDNQELKGKIYFTFVVEKDGSLSDIKILRDLGFNTGNEVIRILKNAPKWVPGKQNNKALRTLNADVIIIK